MTDDFFNQGPTEQVLRAAAELGIELDAPTMVRNDSGSDFVVYEVDATDSTPWIFRIPRRSESAELLVVEAPLLKFLRSVTSFEVPNWQVSSGAIVAYRRLRGVPAAEEDPKTGEMTWSIDRNRPPDTYIESLGRLMAEIHQVDTSLVADLGLAVESSADARERFQARVDRARAELEVHDSWLDRAAHWIQTEEWWPTELSLIHGDLHPGHTLVDGSGTITGVLDWSDAVIGDPCLEFIECSRKFPNEVLDRIFTAYTEAGGSISHSQRMAVREGIAFAPVTLGLLGIDTGQSRYVDRGNAALRVPTDVHDV